LELPKYTSQSRLRQRLLYAMSNAMVIDDDQAGNALHEWNVG